MKKKIYIAYGSNMSLEQMHWRCPEAEPIGKGIIKDYRLMFKGSKTGSYATIEKAGGFTVPIVLWAVSENDELLLDRYEGFPTFYYKQTLAFEFFDAQGHSGRRRKSEGMAYSMDEKRRLGTPTAKYYEVLAEGYRRFDFDECILQKALEYSQKGLDIK